MGPRSSHHRPREPFLPADDIEEIDAEPVPSDYPADTERAMTIDRLAKIVVDGFSEVNSRFDTLEPRVKKLESDAAWKRWAMATLKAAGPFVAGVIASRYPELAKHVPAILNALSGTP